ncbi:sulfotransferase [Nocardioides sp.]|uniref:sulfotransferase n=1 Tax=Nocardioides sp. TaxID=35761 RepID=UPI00262A52FE|nr:sulfotransferase [Nocardioides sp.]
MFERFRPQPEPEFVFVVTFGRSGSTLVQGLLNAMPRTLIRGENAFFVKGQFESAQAAVTFAERHAKHHAGRKSSAFYGVRNFARPTFVKHARALSLEMLYGKVEARSVDRIGFKEVLWHQIEPDQTEPFFTWFDHVFPGARFVLNTRTPEVSVDSGFWKDQDRDLALARMSRVMEIQEWLEQRWPERTYRTRYETLTGADAERRDAMLTGLAEFVTGACDPDLLARLHATLEVGHGPHPFGRSRRASTATE